MKKLKHIIIVLILIVNTSCSYSKVSQDQIDIYNLVIDKEIVPLMPPPKFGDNSGMSERVKDSLRAIKFKVAVSNRLELYNDKSFNIFGFEHYKTAREDLLANKNHLLINREWTKTNLGHTIKIVDLNKLDKEHVFKEYYRLVFLSNVGFNKTKDKALVVIGLKYGGKLSGKEKLYMLEKVDGKWRVKNEKTISIS
ncbi:hypothetical protein [Snuella sedimenti]|uniref:Uncharacterized protein n=1 Tax=Snuella sedimenti TaxID=2798802 RepID=A0A8J7LNY2_9FLAO|nr:hypothetical protein [Snuella sedimenti]MBJ6369099.1 hypothetical protein [Snuella sedimenti]